MATSLTGLTIASTYAQLLHIDAGPTAVEKTLYSGTGVATALKLSTDSASVGNIRLSGNTIHTLDTDGNLVLSPDGTGAVVAAKVDINGGTIDGVVIGDSTAEAGAFTSLSANHLNEGVYELTGTDIDATNGSIQYKTLAATTTFTESLTSGDNVLLRISGANTYPVTWPTMTWVTTDGDLAPALVGDDVVVIWKEGTTVYGAYAGNYL